MGWFAKQLSLMDGCRVDSTRNGSRQCELVYVLLTGTAQIAESLLLLFSLTGQNNYKDIAKKANAFVRRTMIVDGPPEICGAVKGSFPIDGWYGRWQYLNWACKFMVDANRAELQVNQQSLAK